MIEARGVELRYGTHAVLAGVDVTVRPRGMTAIVGPSGAGKTSLMHILAGLRRPTSGHVQLDGTPLEELTAAKLRSDRFAFVFQDHYLLMYLNAFENVVAALPRPTREGRLRAADLLERLGLAEVASSSAWRLSGGERQRVAIARAMVRESSFLFADEPTAALDRGSARVACQLFSDLAKRQSVVIVTHDPDALALADATIELRDGSVARSVGSTLLKRHGGKGRRH